MVPARGRTATTRALAPLLSFRGPQRAFAVGAWRSLAARIVRDDEVGGSNPLAPTIPNTSVERSRHGVGESMSGRLRGETEPHRLKARRLDPTEQRACKLRPTRPAVGETPGFTEAL